MENRLQTIPDGSVEVQTGLWAHFTQFTWKRNTYTQCELYSAEGYCFYSLSIPENYVEGEIGGELLPLEQRIYAQYMSTPYSTVEEINADIVSLPVEEGYEIL